MAERDVRSAEAQQSLCGCVVVRIGDRRCRASRICDTGGCEARRRERARSRQAAALRTREIRLTELRVVVVLRDAEVDRRQHAATIAERVELDGAMRVRVGEERRKPVMAEVSIVDLEFDATGGLLARVETRYEVRLLIEEEVLDLVFGCAVERSELEARIAVGEVMLP